MRTRAECSEGLHSLGERGPGSNPGAPAVYGGEVLWQHAKIDFPILVGPPLDYLLRFLPRLLKPPLLLANGGFFLTGKPANPINMHTNRQFSQRIIGS
jgi:hypothetical protein